MPITANAATTTVTTSEQYQIYDQRTRDQQVSVNKVWDDGQTNDTRVLYSNDKYPYENYLSITIQTGVPQTTLRTYTIAYDANGGSYGTDTNRNPITTNTITYNAKNQPTNGTYTVPERDGYVCVGWRTSKTATTNLITITNAPADSWMNALTDGSTTTLYAVWQDIHVHYAVMAYGIGIDKDADGNTMGITFGPALGYPEFSNNNNSWWTGGTTSAQTFTKFHSVSGDATVMSESVTACTDDTHSVITGTDAGTDEAGNAYRCLHYDNWATIIYWDNHDPHVYDKCIPSHCSKTVVITPTGRTIENGIFNTSTDARYRGLVGDGQSYIVSSKWDNLYRANITQAGQGYAASLVRTKLVGADSHTKLDDNYAGVDALIKYTTDSSILSCFPKVLRDAIGAKALSGVSAAYVVVHQHNTVDLMPYDEVSNDGAADKLWLFSCGEMMNAVYPAAGFQNDRGYDAKRSSIYGFWLRSPDDSDHALDMHATGWLVYNNYVGDYSMVAPGFTLSLTGL